MVYAPGQSGNPNGRPVGAKNRRTQNVLDQIKDNKDPLVALSELITNSQDESIRATASSMLAPYVHAKQGSIPLPRYVETPIATPDFQTIEDAESFLGKIPQLVAAGELDFQSGLDLSTMTRAWLSAKYERGEMRIKMANANADPNPVIQIRGGLPKLPGTNTIMPQLNGHQVTDEALPWSAPPPTPDESSSDALANESITNDSSAAPPSNETE